VPHRGTCLYRPLIIDPTPASHSPGPINGPPSMASPDASTKSAAWVGLGQPDDLVLMREWRACEYPHAGFESHADWNPEINPVVSKSPSQRRKKPQKHKKNDTRKKRSKKRAKTHTHTQNTKARIRSEAIDHYDQQGRRGRTSRLKPIFC